MIKPKTPPKSIIDRAAQIARQMPVAVPPGGATSGQTTTTKGPAPYFAQGGMVAPHPASLLPGIKYLDAGSRNAGDGSRNYVVFDHNLVKIKNKYERGGYVTPDVSKPLRIAKAGGGSMGLQQLLQNLRAQQEEGQQKIAQIRPGGSQWAKPHATATPAAQNTQSLSVPTPPPRPPNLAGNTFGDTLKSAEELGGDARGAYTNAPGAADAIKKAAGAFGKPDAVKSAVANSNFGFANGNGTNTASSAGMNNYSLGIASAETKHLMDTYGLTREQALGAVGSMAYESGHFQQLQELPSAANGYLKTTNGGYGWAQWTGDRRTGTGQNGQYLGFETWARQHNLDPSSPEANSGYIDYELNGPKAFVIPELKTAKDVPSAAAIWQGGLSGPHGFSGGFEGMPYNSTAGVPAMAQHVGMANLYNKYIPQDLSGATQFPTRAASSGTLPAPTPPGASTPVPAPAGAPVATSQSGGPNARTASGDVQMTDKQGRAIDSRTGLPTQSGPPAATTTAPPAPEQPPPPPPGPVSQNTPNPPNVQQDVSQAAQSEPLPGQLLRDDSLAQMDLTSTPDPTLPSKRGGRIESKGGASNYMNPHELPPHVAEALSILQNYFRTRKAGGGAAALPGDAAPTASTTAPSTIPMNVDDLSKYGPNTTASSAMGRYNPMLASQMASMDPATRNAQTALEYNAFGAQHPGQANPYLVAAQAADPTAFANFQPSVAKPGPSSPSSPTGPLPGQPYAGDVAGAAVLGQSAFPGTNFNLPTYVNTTVPGYVVQPNVAQAASEQVVPSPSSSARGGMIKKRAVNLARSIVSRA